VATNTAQFFNEVADNYAGWYDAASPGGHALRERQQLALQLLDVPAGRVLDVGCGAGTLVGELLKRGYDARGVDAAPRMVEQCRQRFSDLDASRFTVDDATKLSQPDASFDVVTCFGVIDRLPQDKTIRELARVLRPGGTLLVAFPNRVSPYAWWKNDVYYPALARVRPVVYRVLRRPVLPALPAGRAHLHVVASATRILAGAELTVTDAAYYYFNPFLSPVDEVLPRWTLGPVQKLARLRTTPFRWLGAGFILKARKE
jgi:ubiquinone/menaquinone biosynthesis C-methylase UbiE